MVSHDRMFLDQVTNRTIESIHQRLFDFKKPYSQYMVLRDELRAQQQAAQKNQRSKYNKPKSLLNVLELKRRKQVWLNR